MLTAQVKLDLRSALLAGDLPDDSGVQGFLLDYFPRVLREQYPAAIARHPLRREIIATELANAIVDRAGLGWIHRMLEVTTADAEGSARAYLIASAVFGLPRLWHQIDAAPVSTGVAGELTRETIRILDRVCRWLLQRRPQPLDITAEIAHLQPTVAALSGSVPDWLTVDHHIDYRDRLEPLVAAGAERELADTVFGLLERFALLDITEISVEQQQPVAKVAELYYLVKERRRIDLVLTSVAALPRHDRWSALARLGLRDDLYSSLRTVVSMILVTWPEQQPETAVSRWEERFGGRLAKIESVITASRAAGDDLAHVAVTVQQIRTLATLTVQAGPRPPATAGPIPALA